MTIEELRDFFDGLIEDDPAMARREVLIRGDRQDPFRYSISDAELHVGDPREADEEWAPDIAFVQMGRQECYI